MTHTDPIALFTAAADALNRADWPAAAALCDPASVAGFHRHLIEQVTPSESQREISVEFYLRNWPGMPREAAEYMLAQHRKHSDPERQLREQLPGVASLADLLRLSPAEAFVEWIEGRSFQRQVRRMADDGNISEAAATLSLEQASGMHNYVALGAVADGDVIAHIVYQRERDSTDEWSGDAGEWLAHLPPDEQALARDLSGRQYPRVVSCRRQPDGTWLMLAGHDFLSIGSTSVDVIEATDDADEG
ncbi:MAG: hypothetical protein WKF55_12665 [Gemmatimonadaceae bacterium]